MQIFNNINSETSEQFCPNCNGELRYFKSNNDRIDSYCPKVECSFSSNYNDQFFIPYNYYKQNGTNLGTFCFGEGVNPTVQTNEFVETNNNVEEPKEYRLELNDVIGLESVKRQLRRIVNVRGKKRIHCLIISQAGQSKTHILKCMGNELTEQGARVKFIDSSTASRSGIFDLLFEDDYNYIFADELDKLSVDDQYGLLTLAESGLLQQTTSRKRREKHVKELTIIAAANYVEKIVQPLLTRFLMLYIKPYSQEQFIKICSEMLRKRFDYIDGDLSKYIAHKTLEYKKGYPNMRDSVRMALLVQRNATYEEIDKIVS